MLRNLTISIDEQVYDGLHFVIGGSNISRFLEDLARPFVVNDDASAAYAEMSVIGPREAEAEKWCEALADDGPDAAW